MKNWFVILSLLSIQMTYACPIGKTGLSDQQKKELLKTTHHNHSKRKVSSIPQLPDTTSAQPWGGKDQNKWKPESVLANATSFWLNKGWSKKNVEDVLVSVPVRMIFTGDDNRVYGDGQTNASLKFGDGWNYKHPQLIATLVKFKDGRRTIDFNFAEELKFSSPNFSVTAFVKDSSGNYQRKDYQLKVKKVKKAVLANWVVPSEVAFGDLNANRVIWIRPQGWDSSFPIDFKMAIYKNEDLKTFANQAKTLGANPLDFVNVFSRSQQNNENAQTTLLKGFYGSEWIKNQNGGTELRNEIIHGNIGNEINAVGGGLTWLVDRGPHSTFKNLYTCFDARNFEKESEAGVPSGGGWHEIGDAVETIINDLSTSAVPIGFATGLPWATPPDNTKFPWGLTDVATIRLLQPGEGIATTAGDQTWKEDEVHRGEKKSSDQGVQARGSNPSGGGRTYHWFFFPSDEPTCTQEWVHHCRPNEKNNLGLKCD